MSLTPQKDASFGIIPLTKETGSWYVFIIRQANGNRPSSFSDSLSLRSQENYAGHAWGFPKGHAEVGESPRETAERELREETGLSTTKYLPVKPFVTRYLCISHGKYVGKTVTCFVAEVAGTVTLCPQEIVEGAWVTLEEAPQKMQFPEMKEIVETLASILTHNAF